MQRRKARLASHITTNPSLPLSLPPSSPSLLTSRRGVIVLLLLLPLLLLLLLSSGSSSGFLLVGLSQDPVHQPPLGEGRREGGREG